MKSQWIALAAAALLATVSGVSYAQVSSASSTSSGGGGVREACMAGVMKACPDVHDRDSFRACLMSHYADMSDGCKTAVTAMRSSMQSGGGGH